MNRNRSVIANRGTVTLKTVSTFAIEGNLGNITEIR